MRPLNAPDRPIAHYRQGRLRAEPPLTAPSQRVEPIVWRADGRPADASWSDPRAIATAGSGIAAQQTVAALAPRVPDASWQDAEPAGEADDWDAVAASFVPQHPLAAQPAPAGARPHAEATPTDQPPQGGGWLFRRIRPEAQQAARARLWREPPALTRPRAEPRDPAPSRLAYRIERLWLTPLFRIFMRAGLPVLAIAAAGALWLGDEGRRDALAAKFTELRLQFENRPEFMVKLMSIDGASQPVADAVRAMLPVKLPASSFRIDLEAFRAAIEQVDAVESAAVKVRSGGVLGVTVVERKPAILWRTEASLEMLDATGHRVATLLDRSARPDLPVIAGAGAEEAVPEALTILAAAGPILPRVRGLVRVGARRWDLVLDRDQRILLPEKDPVLAIEQIIAIDMAEELLARDISTVDLRNADRPTVRLTEHAVAEMQKLTESVTKVAGQ